MFNHYHYYVPFKLLFYGDAGCGAEATEGRASPQIRPHPATPTLPPNRSCLPSGTLWRPWVRRAGQEARATDVWAGLDAGTRRQVLSASPWRL